MKKALLFALAIVTLGMFQSCNPDPEELIDPQTGPLKGALSGEFSISETQKVVFSQGNLQYQASTGTWRFAENQFDVIGEGNTNISPDYSGWIDLFGFATSGWDNGNTYYHPYDYASCGCNSCGYEYGPTDGQGTYDIDLVGDYAKADWGVFNPIRNGGDKAGLWRCLTDEELKYLISRRPNAKDLRYLTSIDGINGLIILPDSWATPAGLTTPDTLYTMDQWKRLEKAGAVFLPEAGMRHDKRLLVFNQMAHYWTSTAIGGFIPDAAYSLSFNHMSHVLSDMGRPTRYYGCSVRLVHELK